MRAYVDESVRVRAGVTGLYVLGAVLVPQASSDGIRHGLRDSMAGDQRRAHWRADSAVRRRRLVQLIATLELEAVVTIAQPIDPRRQERARRLCLLRLMWELEERGVGSVVLESRGDQDNEDRRVIRERQRAGLVHESWTYEFGNPLTEPLLWLADYVVGSVSLAYWANDGEHLDAMSAQIKIIQVGDSR
jgi:hypothetical protein